MRGDRRGFALIAAATWFGPDAKLATGLFVGTLDYAAVFANARTLADNTIEIVPGAQRQERRDRPQQPYVGGDRYHLSRR